MKIRGTHSAKDRSRVRKLRTRPVLAAVTAASLLAVAACGSGSEEGGDGPIELSYWTSATEPKVRAATEEIIADFEDANPNITVDHQALPFNEYFEKVTIAFGGGNPPDVLWVDSTMTTAYGDQGLLTPLDDYLTEEDVNDFLPNPLEDMTYNDEIQSLALHQSTEALVYVKSVVEEAGVTPPTSYEDGWTFDEMVEAMHAVVDSGIEWGYAPTYGIGQYSVYPFIYELGGSVYNQEAEAFQGYLDSPETIDAVRKWASLYTTEGLAPAEVLPDMLGTKQLAFQETNPFVVVDVNEKYPDVELGVAPLPCDEQCAVASGGWHVGISQASEHQEAAWKLVDALAGVDGAARWSEATHYLPARQSAYDANASWIEEQPWSVFWEGLNEHAVPRPRTARFQLYADEIDAVLRDASRGTDPESGLQRAAEKLEAAAE
jgi:fructooligosaccharide transport system substrate-binding protein